MSKLDVLKAVAGALLFVPVSILPFIVLASEYRAQSICPYSTTVAPVPTAARSKPSRSRAALASASRLLSQHTIAS
jgi:hypothetical protein